MPTEAGSTKIRNMADTAGHYQKQRCQMPNGLDFSESSKRNNIEQKCLPC